jgi:membrane protein DedA with SNARE-associated domain
VNEEPIAGEASAPTAPAGDVGPARKAGPVREARSAGEAAAAGGTAEETEAQAAEEQTRPPDIWSDPRLPWEGKPRRVDVICWAAITLSGLYYLIILPFRASLVGTHPVFLVLLNGSTEGIVSAAAFARVGHGSLAVVLLAAIPGLMKFDIIYWWAGRLWGERIVHLFSGQRERQRRRGQKFVERVNRWGRWFTWPAVIISPFLPIPNAIIYAIAGWTGMSWVTFLVLDAIGTLSWAGMLAGLGYALGQHAVSVAQTVSKYGLWISIGIVVLVIAGQMRSARTQR